MALKQHITHILVGLLLVIPLASCGTSAGGNPTATVSPSVPTSASCPTTATATAHSWVTSDRQIAGSINGGPVGQISNFVYPLGLPGQNASLPEWPGYTTWAPDGKHLATLIQIAAPPQVFSYPYIVDTASHAVAQVKLPPTMQLKSPIEMEWARERSIAWADNDDLLIFAAMPVPGEIGGTDASQTTSYRYNLTTDTLTPLLGVTSALQGVVRCHTLYYLDLSQMKQLQICDNIGNNQNVYWFIGGAYLRRYDLTIQAPVGQPYRLGHTSSCPDYYDGAVDAMGWDVTADGKALVYQATFDLAGSPIIPPSGTTTVQTDSTFMLVDLGNPGSPTQILTGAKSIANAYLAISPDQQAVAVVADDTVDIAFPSNAPVYTGPINGGPAISHSPSAGGLPAWYADSSGFDTSGTRTEFPDAPQPYLEQWQLGMPQAIAKLDGDHHPASLP
jgi:hypothetical protein